MAQVKVKQYVVSYILKWNVLLEHWDLEKCSGALVKIKIQKIKFFNKIRGAGKMWVGFF